MRTIYADHAATTKLSSKAREAMFPWLWEEYGNPSTLYGLAQKPKKAILSSRERIAYAIGAQSNELFFTSGGTEADNWALKGIALRHKGGRVITSAIEHHAILNTCSFLESLGYEVIYLPTDKQGLVSQNDLEDAITPDTLLVSVMMANNELGTIEPIKDLARVAHSHGVLFHTDAVQAVGHIPVNVNELDVDLLSASAHKFNGPKGIGFLYVREGTNIEPLLHGGGQERNMRAGTENVAGIVGMTTALEEHVASLETDSIRLEYLRSKLLCELEGLDFIVNGSENHIPGSLSISFKNVEGEMLLHRLDLMGVSVATGSACNSKETVLSHVISAIKVPEEYANGTVRITLGLDNDEDQVERIASCLKKIIASRKV